ncbi:MAG: HAD family hydrolase [Planctomycetota bacterium]|nr:HAD family hydrolase [Planctomycetota bacterium]
MRDLYDAILLDLDGTLLGQEEVVDPRNLAALRRAQDAGKTVMVVTGRSKTTAMPVVAPLELGEPVVLFNGCAIWCPDGGRMLEERLVSNRTNERLHAWAAERDVQMVVMTADEKLAMAPRSEEESRNVAGFIGMQFVERADLLRENTIRLSFLVKCGEDGSEPLVRELESVAPGPIYVSHFPLSVLPFHSTNPYSAIDVHAPCRGKAEALRFLAETRGIPPERVIAVGDADNDIPMLRGAGLGVAMGNALPEVHAEADVVIDDHRGDAIARLIEERLLP